MHRTLDAVSATGGRHEGPSASNLANSVTGLASLGPRVLLQSVHAGQLAHTGRRRLACGVRVELGRDDGEAVERWRRDVRRRALLGRHGGVLAAGSSLKWTTVERRVGPPVARRCRRLGASVSRRKRAERPGASRHAQVDAEAAVDARRGRGGSGGSAWRAPGAVGRGLLVGVSRGPAGVSLPRFFAVWAGKNLFCTKRGGS